MASTYIIANDNIGLSFTHNSTQMSFYIPSIHGNDNNKIIELCINEILENFNPREPYFFHNKDSIIKSVRIQIESNRDNRIYLSIWPNFMDNVYKLKFIGIVAEPVYYLCTSRDIFNDIIEKISLKYKNCNNGIFKFNNKVIDLSIPLPLDKCGLSNARFNCSDEIIFEKNSIIEPKKEQIIDTNTKYTKLFESYKNIKSCNNYTIKFDGWWGNKSVFIENDSYLYCLKYNILKKCLSKKLINESDLDERMLTPHLEITTSIKPQCMDKYKKYDNMIIKKLNIGYENNFIFVEIDELVHYTLIFKKGINTKLEEYKSIIDDELKIFKITENIIETKLETKKDKKIKEKIPVAVRNTLWSNYFDKNQEGICQCCKKEPITKSNFDCGHVISEKNGGSVHLDNLKPICRACNSSMSIKNMDDFMKQYGFDKLIDTVKPIIKSKKQIDSDDETPIIKSKTKPKKQIESDDETPIIKSKSKKQIDSDDDILIIKSKSKSKTDDKKIKISKKQIDSDEDIPIIKSKSKSKTEDIKMVHTDISSIVKFVSKNKIESDDDEDSTITKGLKLLKNDELKSLCIAIGMVKSNYSNKTDYITEINKHYLLLTKDKLINICEQLNIKINKKSKKDDILFSIMHSIQKIMDHYKSC